LAFFKGDGDSSVAKPYGVDSPIEKVECTNHICRNFNKRLSELSKDRTYPLEMRKLLSKNLDRMRIGVYSAIKKRSNESTSINEKQANLTKDLMNAPNHVFGRHDICLQTSTNCKDPENDVDFVDDLKTSKLWDAVMHLINTVLIKNVQSLIFNVNNNYCERYNSIIVKFIGGKRCNFVQRGSYKSRCEAAAVSFNNKRTFYSKINKAMTHLSPGKYVKRFANNCSKRKSAKCKPSLKFERTKKTSRAKVTGADEDYGGVTNLMDKEEYEQKSSQFLIELSKHKNIQESRRSQHQNKLWHNERFKRLTASNFGKVCKLRDSTNRLTVLKNLLYSNFEGNKYTRWGQQNEFKALNEASTVLNFNYEQCGMFVHKTLPYLGASPDALVGNEGIVEIKCPFSGKHLSPVEAVRKKIIKFCNVDTNNQLSLKKNHPYYYQIQGQLEVTDRKYCIFIVWTPHGFSSENILRDPEFWHEKMEEKLKHFYLTYQLPELINAKRQ
jgi:hypothetical protein